MLLRTAAVLVFASAVLACQSPDERPPAAPGCEQGDRGCHDPVGGGIPGSGSPGGSGGAGPDTGVTLTGSVGLFSDLFFSEFVTYDADAEVQAPAVGSGIVTDDFLPGAEFRLEGVQPASWVSVTPGAGAFDELVTYHPVPMESTREFLNLVSESTLNVIYDMLADPAVVTPGRGHVVLFFQDEGGIPFAGVTASLTSAEFVAYDAGLIWSDAQAGSGSQGIAILGNVEAEPLPGGEQTVRLEGSASGSVEILVARDAVTISGVVVE